MFRKFSFVLLVLLIVLSACTKKTDSDPEEKPTETAIFSKITLNLSLTNPDTKDDAYMVYLMVPGTKTEVPGEAQQNGFYGPIETDANLSASIDFDFNWDLDWYINEALSAGQKRLQVYVTTKEDVYLRNPLNAETYLDLVENTDEATKMDYAYGSKVETKTISITDAYPSGVLSLTFPDATFVIKLKVPEGTTKSYEVSIHKPDNTGTGISAVRTGRIARDFQYYDTPFFKDDNLKSWSGFIVIRDFDTNATVNYEGSPRYIEFDENGKCKDGDIVVINIP